MNGRVGQQLGNYQLIRLLGEGGFAEVYLGRHQQLTMHAAVKVLRAYVKDEDVESFRREAQTAADLLHPHIVRLLDFDVEDGVPFLVMDYASNGSLRTHHPRGTVVPLPAVVAYVKQVAEALQYAHNRKFIHRDVKPENMLLGRQDEVLLTDFGLATLAHNTSSLSKQTIAGTVSYMAPEQIWGQPRAASDQYSLAVVAYEWLCGERPFQGSLTEIMLQHTQVPPPPLCEKMPTIPLAVEQVVLTALAKDPRQRFTDVQTFAMALEQGSQGSAVLPQLSTSSTMSLLSQDSLVGSQQETQEVQHSSVASSSLSHELPGELRTATPPPKYAVSAATRRRNVPWIKTTLLVILALLILVGSSSFIYIRLSNLATAAAAAHAYASAVAAHGIMFGFDTHHTHDNPYEKVLTPTNVFGLKQAWAGSTGAAIYSSPTVANGVVYIGSEDGKLYAFNAQTGATLWTALILASVDSSPAVVDGIVYVGAGNGKVYAFNAQTGNLVWAAITGYDISHSSPVVVDGVVYIGSGDGKVYAFNAQTGVILWTAATAFSINTSPAVANGVIYVGLGEDLHAFNMRTGAMLWESSIGDTTGSSPAVANGRVYIGSHNGKLYAFNAQTGAMLWTGSTDGTIGSSPAVADGVVYVGSFDGELYAFNAQTGTKLWIGSTGAAIDSSPTVANGVVYIGSYDDWLYAFNVQTGATLWTGATGGGINYSSPAVADGVVYVGSGDGKLYAFHL